jgi:urea transporter
MLAIRYQSALPSSRGFITPFAIVHTASHQADTTTLRTLLRSLGQIVLQPNAVTGACLLAAWLVSAPRLACAALIGAVAANVGALLAGYDDAATQEGLRGFNGALAGLAAFSFIADDVTAGAVALLAGTATAWGLGPWSGWLRKRGLSAYSSPCLIVTWLWLPLIKTGVVAIAPAHVDHVNTVSRIVEGSFSGVAQTGFASGAVAGALVIAGIAASSWRLASWALIGASATSAAHLLLGANPAAFEAGVLGFNGALTALALVDSGWLTVLGGLALSIVFQQAAAHLGWPVMTAPFVVATWSMQWLARYLRRRASLSAAGRVESSLSP